MSAPEDVREFLRGRGLADVVVDAGIPGLIEGWEQTAREAERERYPFGIEDWLDELDGRHVLHELDSALPHALSAVDRERLAEADHRLLSATELAPHCLWGEVLARRNQWTPKRHWWYWRQPRRVEDDFGGDATE